MSDVVAFLLARLDEDEAWIRGCDHLDLCQECGFGQQPESPFSAARVLREVEAKRQIVSLHEPRRPGFTRSEPGETPGQTLQRHKARTDTICSTCVAASGRIPAPCPTLRLLILPFSDHPDFDQKWALS